MTDSKHSSLTEESLWIAAITASESPTNSFLNVMPMNVTASAPVSTRTSMVESADASDCPDPPKSATLMNRHSASADMSGTSLAADTLGAMINLRARQRQSNQSYSSQSPDSRPLSSVSSTSSLMHEPQMQLRVNYSGQRLETCPTDVPPTVYALNLSFNQIQVLPTSFIQPLCELRILDLSGNQLRTLPDDFGIHLCHLRELRLSKNRLETLPPSFIALESLELLDLGWNALSDIEPRLFQNMRNLRHLWLQHNRLQTLPPSIGLLSSTLIDLLLDGNPFTTPMDALVAPLLLLSQNSTGRVVSSNSTSSTGGNSVSEAIKARLRKSPSLESKLLTSRMHWQRARMVLARTRTKNIVAAAAAQFLSGSQSHQNNGENEQASVSSTSSASVSPQMSSSTELFANTEQNSQSEGKSKSGLGLLRRMRKISASNTRLDELDKQVNALLDAASFPNVTSQPGSPLPPVKSCEEDALNKPIDTEDVVDQRNEHKKVDAVQTDNTQSGPTDLDKSPTSPLEAPAGVEQEATNETGNVDAASPTAGQRDSGYCTDKRLTNTDSELDGDEPALSPTMFSEGDRTVLETVDSTLDEEDHLSSFNVSDEVAALAAATKAAFMRRTRCPTGQALRQRASLPTLRGPSRDEESTLRIQLRHRSDHPQMNNVPTSPLANKPVIASSDSTENQHLDTTDLTATNNMNTLPNGTNQSSRLPFMRINSDSSLPKCDNNDVFASHDTFAMFHSSDVAPATMMGSAESSVYPYGTEGTDEHAVQRRQALRRLLGHLRDLWDLGIGTKMVNNSDIPVRLLESQPGASVPEEIIGNRPVSMDVNGLLRLAERRRRIVEEIVATERTYVRELTTLEKLYLRPAVQRNALTPEEIRTAFGNLETLIMFHREYFLPRLEEALANVTPGSEPPIGQVFMDHCAYIKMYSVYVNNFEHAHMALEKWETSKSHKRWRQVTEAARNHRSHTQMNIQSYLVMPVQRIPRYRLLLQELFDHTPRSHPDYASLKAALDEISKRADEINERKRDHEQSAMVLRLQHRIKGSEKLPLLQPHRRFVKEFSLRVLRESRLHTVRRGRPGQEPVVTVRQRRVEKDYLFFLFSDILLQCKIHGHLNKETELVRAIQLGGRREQVEYSEADAHVRIVDEDVILYVTGVESDLCELARLVANN